MEIGNSKRQGLTIISKILNLLYRKKVNNGESHYDLQGEKCSMSIKQMVLYKDILTKLDIQSKYKQYEIRQTYNISNGIIAKITPN